MNTDANRFLCLTTLWCVVTVPGLSDVQDSDNFNLIRKNVKDPLIRRVERGLPSSIGKLLNTATRTYCANCYNVFFKRGTYRDAIKDFRKLKPTNVIKYEDRTVGTVGDSIVEVYKREFTKRGEMRIVDRDMTVSPKGVEDVYVIEYSPKVHHQS